MTKELTRDEPSFDGLLVQGAKAMQTLASKSNELTELVSNTSQTAAAVDRQSQALQQSLDLLPGVLRRSTTTFAGLDTTLDALTPVVDASKPNLAQLPQFESALNTTSKQALPTVGQLNDLISNPSGSGDLISLLQASPSLARVAATAYPELIKQFHHSIPQLNYLRDYTPDVVAALSNVGQASSYYDANGHYVRTQPDTLAFQINGVERARRATPLPALRRPDPRDHALPRQRRAAHPGRLDAGGGARLQQLAGDAVRRLAAIAAVLVAAIALAAVASTRAQSSSGSYTVRAIFDDASYAAAGENVRIAGANVGSIESLGVNSRNRAAVTISIDNADFIPFYANATCTIRPQSLIGEEYVNCSPGTSDHKPLATLQSGPGKGEHFLPVTRTSSPINSDIVQNISRMPVQQALVGRHRRARDWAGDARIRPQCGDPAGQPGAGRDRQGVQDPGFAEPTARPARR